MSLSIQPVPPVPEETVRIAPAAFPKGNPLLSLRDELGTIFSDQLFAHLYPTRGQPAEAPWRLARITVRQVDLVGPTRPDYRWQTAKKQECRCTSD